MICRTYLTTPLRLKLTKKLVIDNFGEKFKHYGFISQNNGLSWYALKNGKLLCSIYFEEDFQHNILYRVQPLSARLINPLKKNKNGIADKTNYCESALKEWKKQNPQLFEELEQQKVALLSDEEYIQKKINFYQTLLDTIVFPYIERVKEFSDIICTRDREIIAVNAYLSNSADAYYNSSFVIMSLHDLSLKNPSDLIGQDKLQYSVRQSAEKGDMSIVGKCLQAQECSNIEYLKSKLPKLFKSVDIQPVITEEYINNIALSEVRTTNDYNISIPSSLKNIHSIEHMKFPISAPNPIINADESKKIAQNVIEQHLSSELKSRGFISRNDGFEWHKLVDDMIYYRIWFVWLDKTARIEVYYKVSTLCDLIEIDTLTYGIEPQYANLEYLKLINSPALVEFYPNSFNSGDEVLDWQINRLKCYLYYLIFPYFDKITNLEELCMANGGDSIGAILLGNDDYIPEHKRFLYETYSKHMPVCDLKLPSKLPKDSAKWLAEQWRVISAGLFNNDRKFILDYLQQCREYNLKLLQDKIPELFHN